ncbi:hypothetical protein GJ496_002272 [Pomphorhynchus laevis]|nr:hypothetical protein GJ496_002272 [Pomphorhynchus laevis]
MNSKFNQCQILNEILDSQDGIMLKLYISSKYKHVFTSEFINLSSKSDSSNTSTISNDWFDFLDIVKVDHEISYDRMLCAFKLFSDKLLTQSWHLPLLYSLSNDLTGKALDERFDNSAVDKAADILMHAFRCCIRHRQWSAPIPIANCLFKLYNRMGRLILCKPLLRAFSQKSSMYENSSEDFLTTGDKLSFLYYAGICNCLVFQDCKQALFDLEYVFRMSSTKSKYLKQSQNLLKWLLPLKLSVKGEFPKNSLLTKYKIDSVYSELLLSVRSGQPFIFDKLIYSHVRLFLKWRTLMIWQSCRIIAVRNMFRRIILAIQSHFQYDNKINITDICKFVLACCTEATHFNTDECILLMCQLINDGFLKAYISEKHMKVVLSKEQPFPKISEIL